MIFPPPDDIRIEPLGGGSVSIESEDFGESPGFRGTRYYLTATPARGYWGPLDLYGHEESWWYNSSGEVTDHTETDQIVPLSCINDINGFVEHRTTCQYIYAKFLRKTSVIGIDVEYDRHPIAEGCIYQLSHEHDVTGYQGDNLEIECHIINIGVGWKFKHWLVNGEIASEDEGFAIIGYHFPYDGEDPVNIVIKPVFECTDTGLIICNDSMTKLVAVSNLMSLVIDQN